MDTNINFTNDLSSESDANISYNLPRKIYRDSLKRAVAAGATAEAESCTYNIMLDMDYKRLLNRASLLVTPTLYKEGVLYPQIPTYNSNGDFSVTRATTATRVNAAGLVELVPYNLVTWSQDFSNANWTKNNGATITTNTTTAPDGTTSADTLQVSTTIYSGLYEFLSGGSGDYSVSIFAKKLTKKWLYLFDASATSSAWFDLENGVLGTVPSGYTASIENVGDGWYRCIIKNNSAVSPTFFQLGLSDANASYTPTSSGTAYLWGAQLTESSTALTYQRTETRLNIPRLDYSNGTCPSLLVEPQRTNLLKYSQDYSNVIWTKAGITATLGTQINPQGIASTYNIANTTLGDSYLEQQGLPITSGTYTTSVFIKNIDNLATTQLVAVHIAEGSITSELLYTWATNTFVLTGTNAISGKVTPYANGWIRISFTYSIGALTTLHWSRLYANSTLSVTKSALVYGFQTELGSYPTSYIPTTSAAVTRNADVISKTGISSLIGQSEGTIFWDIDDITGTISGTGNPDLGIRNTAFTNWIGLTTNTFAEPFRIVVRPTSGIMIDYTANITRAKAAVKYGSFGAILFVNGVQVATSAVNPNFTFDIVDMSGAIISYRNNSFILWPIALTDGEMSMLTSGVYTPALAYAQLGLVSESPACLDSSINALL
jgi:hypothetical protein